MDGIHHLAQRMCFLFFSFFPPLCGVLRVRLSICRQARKMVGRRSMPKSQPLSALTDKTLSFAMNSGPLAPSEIRTGIRKHRGDSKLLAAAGRLSRVLFRRGPSRGRRLLEALRKAPKLEGRAMEIGKGVNRAALKRGSSPSESWHLG